ncbi:restriction endonuclease subunit S [Cellulomonas sp. ATA003]|uniref:restriction endonuclease subunit S n=1 Tax=Cellulomonas sp. ATA003 TaxID=3073064 RepID=UPI0028738BB4|nr:restriction endonuclease subunit S [Cellulomonas sp. ATA003]WNB85479.1 restriction endonuclease subunit S [Cellulomonas sp. ATA003]
MSTLVQTGPFGSQLHADEYVSGGVPVINPSHISTSGIDADLRVSVSERTAVRLSRHRFQVGDVVIARRGELGRCAVVGVEEAGWLCGTGSLIVRPDHGIDSRYLQVRVSSAATRAELAAQSTGATMPNLNAQMIARLRLPVPPITEQREIVEVLAREESASRQRRRVIETEIVLLREYRTRLTSDVVTGRFDVRHIAATLPALDSEKVSDGSDDDLLDDSAEVLEEVDA